WWRGVGEREKRGGREVTVGNVCPKQRSSNKLVQLSTSFERGTKIPCITLQLYVSSLSLTLSVQPAASTFSRSLLNRASTTIPTPSTHTHPLTAIDVALKPPECLS